MSGTIGDCCIWCSQVLFFSGSFVLFSDCDGYGSSKKLLNGFQSQDTLPLQGYGKLSRVNFTSMIIILRST